MNRKRKFLLAMCAFIFVCSYSPNAFADDCTLGKAWDVLLVYPYLGYFSLPIEVCFYQDGTAFACDPWNKRFLGTGTIFPETSCAGDRTTVYNTWLRVILDPTVPPLWAYLKVAILQGDRLFFGWGIVPSIPSYLFNLSHGRVRDFCLCSVVCLDNDMDGYGFPANERCTYPEEDCDDSNPEVNPAATEGPEGDPTCSDTLDNDCDGSTDLDDTGCSPT